MVTLFSMVHFGFVAGCILLLKLVKLMEHLPLFTGKVMEWFGGKMERGCFKQSDLACTPEQLVLVLSIN